MDAISRPRTHLLQQRPLLLSAYASLRMTSGLSSSWTKIRPRLRRSRLAEGLCPLPTNTVILGTWGIRFQASAPWRDIHPPTVTSYHSSYSPLSSVRCKSFPTVFSAYTPLRRFKRERRHVTHPQPHVTAHSACLPQPCSSKQGTVFCLKGWAAC